MEAAAPAPTQSYPVRYDVGYPQELNRWLIFVKWILAIPHFIILYGLSIAAGAITFIAFFAILFTKRYPKELFRFVVNIQRWNANVSAYTGLLRDEYPPFSWEPGKYPVDFDVEYPEELSRWLIFVKWILVIPHLIILTLLGIVALLVMIIAFFAILFTQQFPESMFKFVVGVNRWSQRASAYVYLLRDEYPPFSMEP